MLRRIPALLLRLGAKARALAVRGLRLGAVAVAGVALLVVLDAALLGGHRRT